MKVLSRRGVLSLVLLAGFAVSASPSAEAESPRRRALALPSWELELQDAFGEAWPMFSHAGQRFVLGELGERYAIRVRNPTSERVEVVVSVDGRDVISGRAADYGTQRGYIVAPFAEVVIEGFRKSLGEVRAFRFSEVEASYSARLGTPENVGVVGVAIFKERARRRERALAPRVSSRAPESRSEEPQREGHAASSKGSAKPAARKSAASGADGRGSAANSPRDDVGSEHDAVTRRYNLGTEYGEERVSAVVEVPFQRRSGGPERVLELRYDDARGLAARGIDVSGGRDQRVASEPRAFPASRFAAPPPLRR